MTQCQMATSQPFTENNPLLRCMEGKDAQSSKSPMANLSIGDEYKAMLAQVITIHLVLERTLFSVAEVRKRVMMMSIEYSQEHVGKEG